MEIEQLSLRIDEAPLNELIASRLPKGTNLQEIKVLLQENEVTLEGKYFAVMFSVGFKVILDLQLAGDKILVNFKDFKIQRMPAALFKNMLIEFISDQTSDLKGITTNEQGIVIEPEIILASEGIKLGGKLRKIECLNGSVRILAGN